MMFPKVTGKGVLMERPQFRQLSLRVLCLILLLSSNLAAVENQRGFAGFYQAQKTSDGTQTVQVTLAIRFFNYSRSNVSDGVLELRDSLPPHKVVASLSQVSIIAGGSLQVTGDFTLPRSEYVRWQNGGHPEMTIEFRDADGHSQSQALELARGRAGIGE